MLEIELEKKEYDYLCHASFMEGEGKSEILSEEPYRGKFLLKISEAQADKIRDLCGEQLQLMGFDEKYKPTVEGEILESLIDKLFVG